MGDKLTKIFIFVAGATIGSLATFEYVKDKYEKIANNEIEAIRAYYHNKTKKNNVEDDINIENETEDVDDEVIEKYRTAIVDNGYTNYNDISSTKSEKEIIKEDDDMKETPYVITPNEFGEIDEYDTVSLTYYADDILADDQDQIIDDVEDVIGDALEHIGDYEDDAVHVRNDELKTDFEILRDLDRFCDIVS